jgi:ATP-dependent RNA helicase DDX50
MREKLNGDTKEGLRFSDEFSPSHKSRRKDLPKGDVDEYEKRSNRVSTGGSCNTSPGHISRRCPNR